MSADSNQCSCSTAHDVPSAQTAVHSTVKGVSRQHCTELPYAKANHKVSLN
jgi:hypothetical protein